MFTAAHKLIRMGLAHFSFKKKKIAQMQYDVQKRRNVFAFDKFLDENALTTDDFNQTACQTEE